MLSWYAPVVFLDCYAKIVTSVITDASRLELEWKGTPSLCPKGVIFFLCSYSMVEKG